MTTNRHNILHKRQQYSINQLKKFLKNDNLTIVKAEKTKAIVIISKEMLKDKVNNFIIENHMEQLNKDPTEAYQKQIQQTIQKCNRLIDKHVYKYLLNIKPIAPQLNVYIKIHKENQPIRAIINKVQAPSYKVSRYINKRLQDLIALPYMYNTKNSQEIAEVIKKLKINEHVRIITLDIKNIYVNLPIKGIIQTARFWLNKNNKNNKELNEQTLHILNTIMKQNYFQYYDQIFQPQKGIAMGSPISGTMAEIYFKYLEATYIKHWLDNKEIVFYKRYVDGILIIYDQRKTNEKIILHQINRVDKILQFKISIEENNTIHYLDISIYRNNENFSIGIYRKPTETGMVIHLTSNHPYEQKLSAFIYYINRLITLPITQKSKQN
jgi:allophanate hydrolase subunit 1